MDLLWGGKAWGAPGGPQKAGNSGDLPLGFHCVGEISMVTQIPMGLGRASSQLAVQTALRGQGHSPGTRTRGRQQGSLFWREGQTRGLLPGFGEEGSWNLNRLALS